MAGRRARLERDVEAIVAVCEAHSFLKVINASRESLVLSLTGPKEKVEYTFTFTEDYPENTIVCCSQDKDGVSVISKRLTYAIQDISSEHGIVLPSLLDEVEKAGEEKSCEMGEQENDKDTTETMELQMEGEKSVEAIVTDDPSASKSQPLQTETLNTQVSTASSEYTEGSEEEMEDFYEDYDAYDADIGGENTMHPLLEKELSQVQEEYGQNAIETRIHAGIDEMDIFINIDLNNFFDEHTASAWGVALSEPLVILVHVQSMHKYLDGLDPKVDVFQHVPSSPSSTTPEAGPDKKKVGISVQLRRILQTFVSRQWKDLSVSTVEKQFAATRPSEAVPSSTPPNTSEDAKVAKLVEMGFSADEAREALRQTGSDLEEACELLTQGSLGKISSGFSSLMSFLPGYKRQTSIGAQLQVHLDEQKDPENDKKTPGLEKGFLVQVVRYALNRLQSLNEFCVICDEKHVLETGLIKPCVCTRELCVFAFQTLGVMADAAEAIATDADVVDLLIAMANSAAHSNRANLILDPYPSIVDPSNVNQLALDPQKKNFDLVKAAMKEVVLSRESLLKGRTTNLKQNMDEKNKLAFPLMQWIIATCRAHIILLPQDRQIKSMETKYQFLLISSPPAKEVAFQQAKQKLGSTFAFHGSTIENWHSIMRKGLINASGTKYQLHGAAYGRGIYLSPLSTVSFGYSGYLGYGSRAKPPGSRESLAGKLNLRCVALCEVVTSKDLKKSGDIWVCPNSDHVCTRFFFVYDETSNSTAKFDTRQGSCKKEIDHAIAHIRAFKKFNK